MFDWEILDAGNFVVARLRQPILERLGDLSEEQWVKSMVKVLQLWHVEPLRYVRLHRRVKGLVKHHRK